MSTWKKVTLVAFLLSILICIVMLLPARFSGSPGICLTGAGPNITPPSSRLEPVHEISDVSPEIPLKITEYKSVTYLPGLELYIYRAFLDDRFTETAVRIYALEKKNAVSRNFTCRWTFMKNGLHAQMDVSAKKYMVDESWPMWSKYFAVTYDCLFLSTKRNIPSQISLESLEGDYKYELPVERTNTLVKRKPMAICLKPVTGTFSVARIIEWFEMTRLTGIEDVILYNTDLHGNARFAIDYYAQLGVANILPFPYLLAILQLVDSPDTSPQDRYAIYQQVYLIAMHDCLHRFYGTYEHLLFLDLDEIYLPTKNESAIEMIDYVSKLYTYGAGFLFFTAWHFEEMGKSSDNSIPSYLYMHQYKKATKPEDVQPKSIIVTDRALSFNFHQILDVGSKQWSIEPLPPDQYGYIHHFRGRCDVKFEDYRCKVFLKEPRDDMVLSRYYDSAKSRVKHVLDLLML